MPFVTDKSGNIDLIQWFHIQLKINKNKKKPNLRIGLFQKKIHTSLMDGILEILTGGVVKDQGNPGGKGGWTQSQKSSAGVISTDSSCN